MKENWVELIGYTTFSIRDKAKNKGSIAKREALDMIKDGMDDISLPISYCGEKGLREDDYNVTASVILVDEDYFLTLKRIESKYNAIIDTINSYK